MKTGPIPPSVAPKRVLLGLITTAHGIRGEVMVRSFTAPPERLASYEGLETIDGMPVPKLSLVRATERGLLVRLNGVSTRTAAESYRGTELWIARARLPGVAQNEYYHADLVGLAAVTPDGVALGEIVAIENFGAGDLVEIRLAGSKETEYIPFTDACVPTVDLPAGRIVVVRPDVIEARPEDAAGEEEASGS